MIEVLVHSPMSLLAQAIAILPNYAYLLPSSSSLSATSTSLLLCVVVVVLLCVVL
jgi:hypothetical protein